MASSGFGHFSLLSVQLKFIAFNCCVLIYAQYRSAMTTKQVFRTLRQLDSELRYILTGVQFNELDMIMAHSTIFIQCLCS